MKRTSHEKYTVALSQEELRYVQTIIMKGVSGARVITRARILLAVHEGKKDREICTTYQVVRSTVHDTRKHYHESGLRRALYDEPRSGQPRKLTGLQEAKIVAIACTKAPKGYDHWTMNLLTEEAGNKLHTGISRSAIYQVLLRNYTKPWRKKTVLHSK